ncbi:MAG: nitronate monooxygenase [Chloroflexi bacterium]|nr:MAG: nitronate monooxygenase [Chloroflexota bacterium]
MLKTELCARLGIEHPILSAGFGPGAGPEVVAAVSNAGGCGVLGASGFRVPYLRGLIRRVRALTSKPFGVNLILEDIEEGPIEACLDERVPLLVFFWGDPAPYVGPAHARGVKVAIQVGSAEEAREAAEAGVDFVIAQGVEAGGHVRGTTALSVLVPAVVDVVAPLPVLASGGVADGRGLVAALSLGAQGVSMGTRFVASEEAFVPPLYKARIVSSQAEDTVYTEDLFDVGWPNAPHRVLRNAIVREWEAAGRPPSGQRPGEGTTVGSRTRAGETWEIPKYASITPTPEYTSDLEYLPFWAGQTCSLIHDIKPAGQVVRDIVAEAEQVIDRLARIRSAPQPV